MKVQFKTSPSGKVIEACISGVDIPGMLCKDTELSLHDLVTAYIYEAGEFVAIGAAPTMYHSWSDESSSWVVTEAALQVAKDKRCDDVSAYREARIYDPFSYSGAVFDGHAKAQRNISEWATNVANGFSIPEGFVWVAEDNTAYPANGDFIKGMALTLSLRGTTLYQTSWALKSRIQSMQTLEAVLAFDIAAEWAST